MKLNKLLATLAIFAITTSSFASGTRVLDGAQITNGAATLTLPSTTDTVVGRATTDTLTNKSISGATNTLSAIPASAISSGQLGVANGGTGTSTLTAHGLVVGNGTSAVNLTSVGASNTVLHGNTGADPTYAAVSLTADVSGTLPVANGGTGAASLTANSLVAGNGTSAVNLIAPGSSGNVLTSNGTVWASSPLSVGAPTLNASVGSPQSVTAAGGVSLSSITYSNIAFIQSNSGAVTVTATPSVTAGTAVGQQVMIFGESNTNTVRLDDEATTAGSKLHLNGPWIGAQYSALQLVWDGSFWNEVSRR